MASRPAKPRPAVRIPADLADHLACFARDVECGLHSGIPPCCVLFYVAEWRPLVHELGNDHPAVAAHSRRMFRVRPGYVPCPACMRRGAFVRIRDMGCCEGRGCRLASRRVTSWGRARPWQARRR